MRLNEHNDRMTNRGWEQLYQRLEQDGLLTRVDTIRPLRKSPALLRTAAGLALLVGITAFLLLMRKGDDSQGERLTLQNAKGNPTLVASLEDGSTVYLSEQGSIEYPDRFAKNKREVFLRGNAFFEVTGNRERPFIVETKTVRVEVVGTAFDVKTTREEFLSLSVRSGRVKVTAKKSSESMMIRAGETALLHEEQWQMLPSGGDGRFDRYLKYIHFKDQRLSDVVRIINAHSGSVQLKIAPELANRLLTVTFSDDSPETMAELIGMALHLRLTKQENALLLAPAVN